jgi:hypothetical protein
LPVFSQFVVVVLFWLSLFTAIRFLTSTPTVGNKADGDNHLWNWGSRDLCTTRTVLSVQIDRIWANEEEEEDRQNVTENILILPRPEWKYYSNLKRFELQSEFFFLIYLFIFYFFFVFFCKCDILLGIFPPLDENNFFFGYIFFFSFSPSLRDGEWGWREKGMKLSTEKCIRS